MIDIVVAGKGEHEAEVRQLFHEYLEWANARVNEEFHANFDTDAIIADDMQRLDKFMPPAGRLLLAYAEAQPAGIGCLKQLHPNIGEIKRMYVRPQKRGKGLGRALLDRLLMEAGQIGYERVRLDSARFMTDAHHLYRSAGFQDIEAYEGSEIPKEYQKHWIFMEAKLPSNIERPS